MRRRLSAVFLAVLCLLPLPCAGCGTLFYPERRGQDSGDIDPTVAILDGVGLLFFVVPGLVAYVIDFSTGAIYLPPGEEPEIPIVDDDKAPR